MELLPAIVGLAVVDSINPSALLATIVLLLRGRRARPLVAVYLTAVLATYLTIGVVLTLGLGLTPEAVIQSDAAYLVQGVLGAVMLAASPPAPCTRRCSPSWAPPSASWRRCCSAPPEARASPLSSVSTRSSAIAC
jgi:Sap, sulfolipid-1-addressing protein